MASISTDSKGLRRILFTDADGQRRQIHLGRLPIKTARTIKGHVENMVAAALGNHTPDRETSAWVGGLDSVLYDKLAAVGLVSPRETRPETEAIPWTKSLTSTLRGVATLSPAPEPIWKTCGGSLSSFSGPSDP